MNTKKTISKHIIVKVLQVKDKEKNLKAAREKKIDYFQKRTIKLTVDSQWKQWKQETME